MFPSTTLSGASPAMKSSNDGPLLRVEVNEVFVRGGTEATVANERMAVPQDRWRSNCGSEVEMAKVIVIPLKNHVEMRRERGQRPGQCSNSLERQNKSGQDRDDGVVCQGRLIRTQTILCLIRSTQPVHHPSGDGAMNALSRREEDTLMKATKANALKECDPLVKRMRNLLICLHLKPKRGSTWSQNLRNVQLGGLFPSPGLVGPNTRKFRIVFLNCACFPLIRMGILGADVGWCPSTGPEKMKVIREEYLRLRDQPSQNKYAADAS